MRQIQKKTRAAYWIYIEAIISPMADDYNNEAMPKHQSMKRIWSFIKSNRKDFSCVQSLRENRKTIEDPKEMPDVLNRQFESVF